MDMRRMAFLRRGTLLALPQRGFFQFAQDAAVPGLAAHTLLTQQLQVFFERLEFAYARGDVVDVFIEQGVDVVKSAITGTDRVRGYHFGSTLGAFTKLFDGNEKLISITSVPWYVRQVLP